jgi:hypothetical protein
MRARKLIDEKQIGGSWVVSNGLTWTDASQTITPIGSLTRTVHERTEKTS